MMALIDLMGGDDRGQDEMAMEKDQVCKDKCKDGKHL